MARARKIDLVGIGILLVGAILVVAGSLNNSYQVPTAVTEFKGLKLGDTLTDACFKLGPPSVPTKSSEDDPKSCTSNTKETETRLWGGMGLFGGMAVFAKFQNERVTTIYHACNQSDMDDTYLQHIRCGDKAEDIEKTFHGEVQVFCHVITKDKSPWTAYEETSRVYAVPQYGTRYYLTSNQIFGLEIFSSRSDIADSWEPCH